MVPELSWIVGHHTGVRIGWCEEKKNPHVRTGARIILLKSPYIPQPHIGIKCIEFKQTVYHAFISNHWGQKGETMFPAWLMPETWALTELLYLNNRSVTKSRLTLLAARQANESERVRCWGKEETLIREPADREDGRLAPQNNHLIWVWMPGSFIYQRERGNEELKSKTEQSVRGSWGVKWKGLQFCKTFPREWPVFWRGVLISYSRVGRDKLPFHELKKGTFLQSSRGSGDFRQVVGERKCQLLSCFRLFANTWTIAHQTPLSMGFPRQEYWTGLPFTSPGDLPDSGIEPSSPALQADSLPSELPQQPLSMLIIKAMKSKTKKQFPTWSQNWLPPCNISSHSKLVHLS